MIRLSLAVELIMVGCTTKTPYKTLSEESPGEGFHMITVDDKKCLIIQNDDDEIAMDCIDLRRDKFKHEILIKPGR